MLLTRAEIGMNMNGPHRQIMELGVGAVRVTFMRRHNNEIVFAVSIFIPTNFVE